MGDLISRLDAIDEVEDTDWYHQNKKGEMVHGANPSDHQAWYKAEDIYKVLESLPSADPERKKGKWDDIGGVIRYGCLFCHHAQERKSNFCPNCGADMKGE